ncbi:MAG: 2-dehydropantoate 2-reductase [Candidatus Korarchaeota archaeon]|nr:2-dehydropantoate 2-reductase [Candidatus Korarchaeota archaeon]NIU84530.1 2-dehydropantoate 2-reductase [Candidatus Thorarchaeota archaeon]NIW14597.1 2-dehydropantoate 2-reductase [Candidatus Thorarchaeota archaeon]NIW52669.1 2-dehydropantoate 2-reductase [Candidatus Korarchaeota archaeon]
MPSPGKVVHAGKGITTFGSLKRNFSTWGQKIATLFSENGLPAEYVEDLAPLLWEKVAINAVINPLTALLTVRNRALCENSALKKLASLFLDEVRAVARREGTSLEAIEDTVFQVSANTGDNRSSMLQDILQQKRTEIDFINGAIIERAKKHEMTVPFNLCLFLLVKSKEKSYL